MAANNKEIKYESDSNKIRNTLIKKYPILDSNKYFKKLLDKITKRIIYVDRYGQLTDKDPYHIIITNRYIKKDEFDNIIKVMNDIGFKCDMKYSRAYSGDVCLVRNVPTPSIKSVLGTRDALIV